jgi:hypothetical protein
METDNGKQTVAAGPITFVVEFRRSSQDGVSAGGPTVRVSGTDDSHEYLRIDMFDRGPHYHYEPPGDVPERRLYLDTVAEGDAVEWGLDRLRRRLGPMMEEAQGGGIYAAANADELTRAVDDVERIVRAGL